MQEWAVEHRSFQIQGSITDRETVSFLTSSSLFLSLSLPSLLGNPEPSLFSLCSSLSASPLFMDGRVSSIQAASTFRYLSIYLCVYLFICVLFLPFFRMGRSRLCQLNSLSRSVSFSPPLCFAPLIFFRFLFFLYLPLQSLEKEETLLLLLHLRAEEGGVEKEYTSL